MEEVKAVMSKVKTGVIAFLAAYVLSRGDVLLGIFASDASLLVDFIDYLEDGDGDGWSHDVLLWIIILFVLLIFDWSAVFMYVLLAVLSGVLTHLLLDMLSGQGVTVLGDHVSFHLYDANTVYEYIALISIAGALIITGKFAGLI